MKMLLKYLKKNLWINNKKNRSRVDTQSQPFFLLYLYAISHLYPPPFTYFLSLINITSLISP